MSKQSPTTIVLDTSILSQAVDDILDTLSLDRSTKSQLLNRVAARIAGPKHNWGFLTGSATALVAQGVDASQVKIINPVAAPKLPLSRIMSSGRETIVQSVEHDPTSIQILWDTDEGRQSYIMASTDVLRLEAGQPSTGADKNAELARKQVHEIAWSRVVDYIEAWIVYAMEETDAGSTIQDAFFQLCCSERDMDPDVASHLSTYFTAKLFREEENSFQLLKDFEFEGARSLYELIESDYASWVMEAKTDISRI